ncbi:hypothetical protein ACLKOZ_16835 [Arthrobacter sp. R4]|uniref:hypothetical protein n=1 Tax=Arthrobacter sp. R4 TaxID=644417 RepID=UPI003EDA3899
MTNQVIPAEAVEAAHERLDAMGSYVPRKYLAAALEAAAPHMLAGAWREGLDAGRGVEVVRNPYAAL